MEDGALLLPEVLDRATAVEVHDEAIGRLGRGLREVVLDLSRVQKVDAFGAAAILEIHRAAKERGAGLVLRNAPERVRDILAFLKVDEVVRARPAARRREAALVRLGDWGLRTLRVAVEEASMNLEGLSHMFVAPFLRRAPRFSHVVRQLNAIGTGSVPIVTLICFLIGLIMALQAAYQLRQFGANIFVADLVGVAVTRELGPLITAIILSARSGSSIAAELGTMVVTEEVEALEVMAVDPRRFLVAPRFIAMAIALPCLTILGDVAGIAGGFVVGVVGLEIGPAHYWNQTLQALYLSDILTGLVKSFVFANVIAVVACHQGLSLRGGPEQVGKATTWAVVLSITIVILADFLFTTVFYLLDVGG